MTATERILKQARADDKGILPLRYDQHCLEIHVSKGSLERSLVFVNSVILSLEAEGFPVSVQRGRHGTGAQIFGHRVPFAIVEKLREKGRRDVKEYSWTRTIIDYEPTGDLGFRVGDYGYGRKYRDGKKHQLEAQLSNCVGALMREGRSHVISAKLAEQERIKRQETERERAELSRQIAEEEKKLKDLETWASNWTRAQQMRDFIIALENVWIKNGYDLSPEAEKGQRIIWMKQQADRLDPMLPSPPSIIDRKCELNQW